MNLMSSANRQIKNHFVDLLVEEYGVECPLVDYAADHRALQSVNPRPFIEAGIPKNEIDTTTPNLPSYG